MIKLSYVSNEVIMSKMGLKAQLYCCIINSEFVGWVFLDNRIEPNSKYTLVFDRNIGAQILSINNVQESDAGTYFCRVSIENKEARDFPVLVNIRAQLNSDNPKHYLEISKTERIPLNIAGIPFPTVHFYRADKDKPLVENFYSHQAVRNGRYQIATDGDVIINNLVQSDTGRYIIRLNQGSNYVSDDYIIEIYAGARPFVAYMPRPYGNFTLGQNEKIPARFSGDFLNIYWKFTSEILGEKAERIMGDTDAHYFVSVDGALSILNVVNTDSGRYIGVCKNPWGEVQVSTTIIRAIEFAQILILNNQVASIGNNATFRVEVNGSPPPYVSWWRNGVQIKGIRISERISELRLINISRNDAGIYTCVVDNGATLNGVRSYSSKNVSLYVEGFPAMDVKQSSKVLIVTENRRIIRLKCVVNGLPYSEIRFRKGNASFVPTSIVMGQQNKDYQEATLILTIESESQTGNYTCVATNSLGTSTLEIMVKYMDVPMAPRNVHLLQIDTNRVSIGWDMSENRGLSHSFSYLATIWNDNFFYSTSKQVYESSVIFNALDKGKIYHFSVRSSNIAGWSLPSNTITFKTPNVGRPSPPQVLNREIFLETSDFRLYWASPIDNGGDFLTTYSVRKCLWDTERIILDKNCETFSGIRSNEMYFSGLLAFQLYNFYVSADNSKERSQEAKFQVFSGQNAYIGNPGTTSPEVIAISIILLTLLFILLMDLLLCIFFKTGLICWLICVCWFHRKYVSEEQIPLRRDSMIPIKSKAEQEDINNQFGPIYTTEMEKINEENFVIIEDQMYQEISEEKRSPKIIKNKSVATNKNSENTPILENIKYSNEKKKSTPKTKQEDLIFLNESKIKYSETNPIEKPNKNKESLILKEEMKKTIQPINNKFQSNKNSINKIENIPITVSSKKKNKESQGKSNNLTSKKLKIDPNELKSISTSIINKTFNPDINQTGNSDSKESGSNKKAKDIFSKAETTKYEPKNVVLKYDKDDKDGKDDDNDKVFEAKFEGSDMII
ncbi:hypothetical protein MXB_4020 [Myxobolus squamalis]|nr:hypothetical protein MXB_4020 [Myxobolus squamalis]